MNISFFQKAKKGIIAPVLVMMLILPQGLAFAQNTPANAPTAPGNEDGIINIAEGTNGFIVRQDISGTDVVPGDLVMYHSPDAITLSQSLGFAIVSQFNIDNGFVDLTLHLADFQANTTQASFQTSIEFNGGAEETGLSPALNLTFDPTIPTLLSAKVTGPQTVSLVYSEPVNTTDADYPSLVLIIDNFEPRGVTAVSGSGTSSIELTFEGEPVSANAIASIDVSDTVQDLAGNPLEQIIRQEVTDGQIPVITLNGTSPTKVKQGSVYTDLGATANDGTDNINALIVTTGAAVDTSIDGFYTVTYDVNDAAGNAATQVTRTVIVDGEKPVLTMIGSPVVTINQGEAYADAGATALDDIDGDITSTIVTLGANFDTNVPNIYVVTYQVSDAAGNVADQITRNVVVVDTTKPVIALTGPATVKVQKDSIYTDAGAIAIDNVDGNLTPSIVTANPVNTAIAGTYTVTYNVTDAAGNAAAQKTRTVIVDESKPVLTLTGSATVTLNQGEVYSDAGATAFDDVDGNITALIVAVNPVNTAIPGTYIVTYNISDAAGNVADQITRTVTVLDIEKPVITLVGSETVKVKKGDVYNDAGATALDNKDGDLTGLIDIMSTVDTSIADTYTVKYNVTDAAGNIANEVTRTVIVDGVKPVITLTGSATVTLNQGEVYSDAGATASDDTDGDTTSSVVTVNPVNTANAGTYTVTYNATDAAGNTADQVTRTVTVLDITKPVITLTGSATIKVKKDAVYTDAGAIAADDTDGNLTSAIVTLSTVNTAVAGTYAVTYNVTDAAGNKATEVTRTVMVDENKPVITLTGSATVTLNQGEVYTDVGATASDDLDGDISASVVTVNPVNTAIAGTYTVTYNVTDAAGNTADQVTRTVTVVSNAGNAGVPLPAGGGGITTQEILALQKASTPQVLGAATVRFKEGAILKIKGTHRYYIFKNGKRVRLPNWKFMKLFHGQYTEELDAKTIFEIPYDRTPSNQ